MSHHLDSPLARQDPRLNITDLYVFDVPDATVFVIDVNTSLAADKHAAAFHPEGRYELKVHLDGAEREELTYRFTFSDVTGDERQLYQLHVLDGADASSDAATGELLAEGRTDAESEVTEAGVRVWAGIAADPFFLDLTLLDAIGQAVHQGNPAALSGWRPETASNTFAGSAVHAIVLEVPHSDTTLHQGRDLAVWATAKLGTDAGGWRQINRFGLPMMWPVFWPGESDDSSQANTTHPSEDAQRFSAGYTSLLEGVVRLLRTARDPGAYARTTVERLTPDLMPFRVGTSAAFGFAGFNGRALSDNAPEVMFSLATNSGVSSGLSGDELSADKFPYVVPPTS
jgi:hypothetical protein